MLRIILKSYRFLPAKARWKFLVLLLATLFANLLDIFALLLVGAIGLVASGNIPDIPFLELDGLALGEIVLYLIIGAGLAFTAKTAVGIWLARIRYRFLAGVEVAFSREIARSVFLDDISRMKRFSRSQLEWTIIRSTNTAISHILSQAFQLFAEATLAIAIYLVFIFTDWIVALSVLVYLSLVVLGFQFTIRNANSAAGKAFSDHTVIAMQLISDFVGAFREITVANRSQVFLDQLDVARKKMAYAQAKQGIIEALPRLILEMSLILGVVALIAFEFIRSDFSARPDFQSVAIFLVGTVRLMSALLPLQRAFMALRYAEPQANAAHDVLAQITPRENYFYPSDINKFLEIPQPGTGVSVLVEKVNFRYPDDLRASAAALIDIKLEIPEGSSAGIIGASGAGKSTLIDLILGLHSPDTGSVLISGLSPREFRRQHPGGISYVPQKPGLVAGTLRDNIALGVPLDEIDDRRVEFALEASRLDSFVDNLPKGVNTNLGAQSDSLSGGQIQRLGIARALYTSPRLLVLDEGTSALDPETEFSISEMLSSLSGQLTLLVVAHRLTTVKNLQNIHFMKEGKVAGSGSLESLRREHPAVERYIKLLSFE